MSDDEHEPVEDTPPPHPPAGRVVRRPARRPTRPRQEWAYWFPGIVLSIGLLLAVAGLSLLGFTAGLVWALPIAVGGLLGYGTSARWYLPVSLGLCFVASVVAALLMQEVAGLFCGVILGLFMFLPVLSGVFAGCVLRAFLKRTQFSERDFLPAILVLLAPLGLGAAEAALLGPAAPEGVTSAAVLPLTPEQVWDVSVFGDADPHRPVPLVCVAGLPAPRASRGSLRRAGDIETIALGDGHVTLRVTESRAPSRLRFEVVEQVGFEERAVTLLGGEMEIVPVADGGSRVRLTTRYRPLLRSRIVWRPAERLIADALQSHVLSEIAREARAQTVSQSSTSRGQFQRSGNVSAAPRLTRSVDPGASNRSPFQR